MDNELLATSCYNLEGNEVLIVFGYSALQTLLNSLDRTYDLAPRVFEWISDLDGDAQRQWIDKYEELMAPLRTKLRTKMTEVEPAEGDKFYLKKLAEYKTIMMLKCARFFNPQTVAGMFNSLLLNFSYLLDMIPTRTDVEILATHIPFVTREMLDNFCDELPRYITHARAFNFTSTKLNERAREVESFWLRHADDLPACRLVFELIAILNVSSGAAERLISIFTTVIGMM